MKKPASLVGVACGSRFMIYNTDKKTTIKNCNCQEGLYSIILKTGIHSRLVMDTSDFY